MGFFKTGTIKEDYWTFHRCPNRGVSSNSILHMHAPVDPDGIPILDDWADAIEEAASFMAVVSAGRNGGCLVLHGMYPISRKLILPEFTKLYGAWPVMQNSSADSCGLYPNSDFNVTDDWLVEWTPSSDTTFYSNFGAGIRNIFLNCIGKCSGADFWGSQQSSNVDSVVIKGFGPGAVTNRYGISFTGDTYAISNIFIDAGLSGETSSVEPNSVGLTNIHARLVNNSIRNVTAHNCEEGFRYQDIHNLWVENFETEITDYPIVGMYNVVSSHFMNCGFRHTDYFADIRHAEFPNAETTYCRGQANGQNDPLHLKRPDGTCVEVGRYPDFIMQDALDRTDTVVCPVP